MCILTRVQTRCYDANFPVYWLQFNEIRAQIERLCPLVNESTAPESFEERGSQPGTPAGVRVQKANGNLREIYPSCLLPKV